MNDKKIIDKKEVYNNFLDRAVNMAKQGKRQNILTPAFYDAVRIGKDFFDLSQEEVYDEIEKRLSSIVREEDDKDPVTTVDDIASSYMTKINAQVNSPKAFANAILDFINKVQDKEQMDFTKNQKIKYAIQYLQQLQEASEEDVENQKEYNKELQITAKLQDKLKERIAHKVREKLEKESLEEGKKESTAEIKQRIKDLVQKLKDQNDHLYPEGAKDLAIDMIKKMDIKEATKEEETEFHKKLDKLVHDTFGKRKEEIGEAKLDFMGTADEETMKYLQEISREELVALEKQFVEMFDTLGVIRYNASEQLSKGASEISQRIHNFITIFRQAIKGYPVVKEETIDEGLLDQKSPQEIKRMHKTLKDAATLINTLKFYGTDEQQKFADKIHGTGGMYKLMATLQDELEKRERSLDEGKTESLTNNHSNPVLEAAKKKLVDRINSIALKEGISKKEATIRVVKALKESK